MQVPAVCAGFEVPKRFALNLNDLSEESVRGAKVRASATLKLKHCSLYPLAFLGLRCRDDLYRQGHARTFAPPTKTVAKWRGRTTTTDFPVGPHGPRSTVLTELEEAVIVEFRRRTASWKHVEFLGGRSRIRTQQLLAAPEPLACRR